ncbi:MAG: putative toxin-antitoxin system toxin component, PIN family [Acidobacteria bacterium]|nr:putative toxin-antitoxin system toxin component, PIN family [Acidobacteriota bacterium]
MKVVVDTNVLVAGLLSATGPPGWIVEAALCGYIEPVFDMAIRQEYEEVLRRSELGLTPSRVDDLLAAVDTFGMQVVGAAPWSAGLPDPDDAPFLAVAAATGSVVVTGNLRHYPPRGRRDVVVLTPRQFVDLVGEPNPPPA